MRLHAGICTRMCHVHLHVTIHVCTCVMLTCKKEIVASHASVPTHKQANKCVSVCGRVYIYTRICACAHVIFCSYTISHHAYGRCCIASLVKAYYVLLYSISLYILLLCTKVYYMAMYFTIQYCIIRKRDTAVYFII